MGNDQNTSPASSYVCGAKARASKCVCRLDPGHVGRHQCKHGGFGSVDATPLEERVYYALHDAGFDETDADRATKIALREVERSGR